MAKAFSASEIAKLELNMSVFLNKVQSTINEAIINGTESVYEYSLDRVPVDTGSLKSSSEMLPTEYHLEQGIGTVEGKVMFGGNGDPIRKKPYNGVMAHASEYMYAPGNDEQNWGGVILTEGFEITAPEVIEDIINRVKNI